MRMRVYIKKSIDDLATSNRRPFIQIIYLFNIIFVYICSESRYTCVSIFFFTFVHPYYSLFIVFIGFSSIFRVFLFMHFLLLLFFFFLLSLKDPFLFIYFFYFFSNVQDFYPMCNILLMKISLKRKTSSRIKKKKKKKKISILSKTSKFGCFRSFY